MKKRLGPKLSINLFNTMYPVIEQSALNVGFKIRMNDPSIYLSPHDNNVSPTEDFDICWYDLAITSDVLYRLKSYQRVSQWPGIQSIAHKNKLAKNLTMLKKEFPEDFDFFPTTYILPYEMTELKNILKPIN